MNDNEVFLARLKGMPEFTLRILPLPDEYVHAYSNKTHYIDHDDMMELIAVYDEINGKKDNTKMKVIVNDVVTTIYFRYVMHGTGHWEFRLGDEVYT